MINYIYQLISPRVFSIKYADVIMKDKVVVKPDYMAICHADQRYYQGLREQKILMKKLPMALIHEACGTVVYDPTGNYQVGESVVMIPNQPGADDSIIAENYRKDSGFLSSGKDGFLREYVEIPANRLVRAQGVEGRIAAISEFVSVAVHSAGRFQSASHKRKHSIGIWGDGSLAYVQACVLRRVFPDSKLFVIGMTPSKLAYFSFVNQTYLASELPESFAVDHAFECCGGAGSSYAIDDIIRCIEPQGTVMLMGVSEGKVNINTRDILEKGLTLVGSSRSGYDDFVKALEFMKDETFAGRLGMIVYEDKPVKTVQDIHRVFQTDLTNAFKTVFQWRL